MVLIIKLHIYTCTVIISVSQVISKVERTSIGYFFPLLFDPFSLSKITLKITLNYYFYNIT